MSVDVVMAMIHGLNLNISLLSKVKQVVSAVDGLNDLFTAIVHKQYR